MEIRQLSTFIIAAQMKSFSKAAEVLGYTQAAVTIQIKNLEEELGVKLFDRVGKQVALTQPGQDFLTHAHGIMKSIDEAIELAKDFSDEKVVGMINGVLDKIYHEEEK